MRRVLLVVSLMACIPFEPALSGLNIFLIVRLGDVWYPRIRFWQVLYAEVYGRFVLRIDLVSLRFCVSTWLSQAVH